MPAERPAGYPRNPSVGAKPGEVTVPSPVLRRLQGNQESGSPVKAPQPSRRRKPRSSQEYTYLGCPPRSALEEELGRLRDKIDTTRFGLYESTFRALEALLRATEEAKPLVAPKSLLGMCLRKVPQLISELEQWEEKDAQENGTRSAIQGPQASFQVYSELEFLGADQGWPPLRAVLRAHGVRLLRDAIAEGLFETPFPTLLVGLCTRSKAYTAAEELLEGLMTSRQTTETGPQDGSALARPVETMIKFAKDTGRTSFMLTKLSELLSTGKLKETWMFSEEFSSVWSSAARAIPETRSCDAAMHFVTTSITVLCSCRHGSLSSPQQEESGAGAYSPQQMIISILASLAATVVLATETISRGSDPLTLTRAKTTVQRVTFIIEKCLAATNNSKREDVRKRRYLLHLAKFLWAVGMPDEGQDTTTPAAVMERAWGEAWKGRPDDRRPRQLYHDSMMLVAAMAHSCGRGGSAPPRQYLMDLCDRLGGVGIPAELLRRRERDGAFLLADRTGDLRDLAFAETFQANRTSARKPASARGNRRSGMAGHYRWEAGISEWIAVSPVLTKPKRNNTLLANPAARNRMANGPQEDEAVGTASALSDSESLSSDDDRKREPWCRRAVGRKSRPAAPSKSVLSLVPDDGMGVGQENLDTSAHAEGRRQKLGRNSAPFPRSPPPLRRVSSPQTRFVEYQSDDELGM